MKKFIFIFLGFIVVVCLTFRIFCGIYVIQPIGLLPKGTTIIYWRSSIDLPFIASPDGILKKSGHGVSIMGRLAVLAKYAEPIKEKKIVQFGYSEQLYLWSTGGKTFDR